MPPSQSWSKLGEFRSEDAFIKYRWESFCCSVVRGVRPFVCSICPGDHEMIERHLHCKSVTCQPTGVSTKCPVRWKVRQCAVSSHWIVLTNEAAHLRGDVSCAVPPRPKVTPEMKAFIHRMDENAVPPRLIWSSLLRAPDLPKPVLGYPSYAQVQRSVRYIRWLQGSKNSIQRVQELVRSKAYTVDIDPETAFVFGNIEDEDGYPFVGNGEDEQPLILGITTLKLLRSIVALQNKEPFLIIHLDAIFKLSDLGYPVITCGFTDKRRVYHLAGLFIVSQRTESEYYEAVGAFARVFQTHMKTALRIDAVMGDAEAAQLNGLVKIAGFSNSKYLMCFFHVLYNVRKRIRHLPDVIRGVVYRGIMDMHYTLSEEELRSVWSKVMNEWRRDSRLQDFVGYFYTQWLRSRFWRWQIYHSPGGFATTNNPCEVFNAIIKRYTQRKAVDTRRLILKLLTIAEDYPICVPSYQRSSLQAPPQEAKKLANVLVTTQRVAVFRTHEESVVRVRYIGDQDRDNSDISNISGIGDSTAQEATGRELISSEECLTDVEKKAASTFYKLAVKWSVRRAHHAGMPPGGWLVRTRTFECTCAFYKKFLSCAHVICGRMALGLSVPGVGGLHMQFKDRRVRLARKTKAKPARLSVLSNEDQMLLYVESGCCTAPIGPSVASSPSWDAINSSVEAFLHEFQPESAQLEESSYSTYQNYRLGGSRCIGDDYTSFVSHCGIQGSEPFGLSDVATNDFQPQGAAVTNESRFQTTARNIDSSTLSTVSRIDIAALLAPAAQPTRSAPPTRQNAEFEEELPIRRRVGRPPVASPALDIQYLLR